MTVKSALFAGILLAQASPLLAQEREWSLNSTDTQSYLVFGVPDTDDVGLSFWCETGKTTLSAFLPEPVLKLKRGQKVTMKLVVDGKTTSLPAVADKDDGTGIFTVEGKFSEKSPLLDDLKKGDSVTVSVLSHSSTYPLGDADFDALINTCNGTAPAEN